jgi:hypothetical protein
MENASSLNSNASSAKLTDVTGEPRWWLLTMKEKYLSA